jgi:rare lipoprotein A
LFYLTKKVLITSCATILLTGCSMNRYIPILDSKDVNTSDKNSTVVALIEPTVAPVAPLIEDKSTQNQKNLDPFENIDNTIRPYYVNGRWYYPAKVDIGESFNGIASWYGPDFHGKNTSSGEPYDMYDFTAAHRTLPFDTMLKVTNLDTKLSTVVRINDRGPFVDDRIIDLSFAAAKDIGVVSKGTAKVKLEVIGFNKEVNFDNKEITPATPKVELQSKEKINDTFIEPMAPINISTSETQVPIPTPTPVLQEQPKISHSELVKRNEQTPIENFAVQIGAFKNLDGATNFSQKHSNMESYQSMIKEFEINGIKIYKVWIVGFKDYQEAKSFITRNSLTGAFIIVGKR